MTLILPLHPQELGQGFLALPGSSFPCPDHPSGVFCLLAFTHLSLVGPSSGGLLKFLWPGPGAAPRPPPSPCSQGRLPLV